MKEIQIRQSLEQTLEEAPSLDGKIKNTVDRSFYQNKQTWQKEDSDRTLSIFRNAIKNFNSSSLEDLTAGIKDLTSRYPINFPDQNLVDEIKNELRQVIGEALQRAASKRAITHEALTNLHEVLLDADLGLLRDIFGSNFIFQIATDILKSHHRVDQFEIYGALSDVVGVHETIVRDLRDDFLNHFKSSDPITSFILKGEDIIKDLELELEKLIALAVGDEKGFKAQIAQVSGKVKAAESKKLLAKKTANKCYATIVGLLSFIALNLLGADHSIALVISLGLGLGILILTS
jgi:hypothetical protein